MGMKSTGETAVFTVRMDRAVLDRLKLIASESHRTISQEIRHLAAQRIAEDDDERGDNPLERVPA